MAASRPPSFQALYNRYRPQRFDALVGQEHVVRTLQNALVHNRLSHAYLFSGERGTGKRRRRGAGEGGELPGGDPGGGVREL